MNISLKKNPVKTHPVSCILSMDLAGISYCYPKHLFFKFQKPLLSFTRTRRQVISFLFN